MKVAVCLLMLLHLIADTVQDSCSILEQGNIRIFGPSAPNLIAGRLEICASGRWKAVYDVSWNTREAVIVCTGKGFPAEGARACSSSCFGSSSLEQGYTGLHACDTTNELIFCGEIAEDGHSPDNNAGVICIKPLPTPPPSTSCPTTDCPFCPVTCPSTPSPTCPTCPTPESSMSCPPCPTLPTTIPQICQTTSDTSTMPPRQTDVTPTNSFTTQNYKAVEKGSREEKEDVEIYISIIASLGAVSAFLLLTLVSMISGWVWRCHRNKISAERARMEINPSYTKTTSSPLAETDMQPNPCYTPTTANPSLNESVIYYSTVDDSEYQEIDKM